MGCGSENHWLNLPAEGGAEGGASLVELAVREGRRAELVALIKVRYCQK